MINEKIENLHNGGKVYLPSGQYDISKPLVIDMPCVKIEGEVWNYPSDPNGVFESDYGTKLRLTKNDIPAIFMSIKNVIGGNVIRDIGIQGNIKGMDTRDLFDFDNPCASAGICFNGQRVDQAEISKVSFCGLASGVCVTGSAEVDACTFEKINADGCSIGFYFAPRASYYAMFRTSVVADNPLYGFFANGENSEMYNLDINDCIFVRNGGAFPESFTYPKSAVCLYKVNESSVRNSTFDMSGTFWYFDDDATENTQRQPFTQKTPALWIEGNGNRITGNTISHSASHAIVIKGDNNVIINNIVDSDIIIDGNNNIVSNNIFTNDDSKIIIAKGTKNTEFINIPEERIVYEI